MLWRDLHSINREQKLYVIRTGGGVSTMGYDRVRQLTKGVLDWLGDKETKVPSAGSIKAYRVFRETMRRGQFVVVAVKSI